MSLIAQGGQRKSADLMGRPVDVVAATSFPALHRRPSPLAELLVPNAGRGGVAVVIAMKRLEEAKTRLSPTYSAAHRVALVLGMLTDTIEAALGVRAVESVTVVTADKTAASAAVDAGARILPDPMPRGHPDPLNAAIRAAEIRVRIRTSNVVALHGDLPALHSDELEDAIAAASIHRRSLVRDRHGTGTAALFGFGARLNPAFGHHSPLRHIGAGAIDLRGNWPGLRCDVDTQADLQLALSLGVGPATWRAAHHIMASGEVMRDLHTASFGHSARVDPMQSSAALVGQHPPGGAGIRADASVAWPM